jgi:nitrite reductase/ring-hydroxylating ferredoxin subunit
MWAVSRGEAEKRIEMSDEHSWVGLIPADRLAPGEMAGVEVANGRLAVYNIDGTFHVTDNVCTHAFAILSDGWLEDGIIECPLHGGRFDVVTGEAVTEPARCPLRTYPARVRNGLVEAELPA